MKRVALLLMAFLLASCGQKKPLTPCASWEDRLWCKGVVNESTLARVQAGNDKPECAYPFVAESCTSKSDNKAAVMAFLSRSLTYLRAYSDIGSGAAPMMVVGERVVWAVLPVYEDDGTGREVGQCSQQPGNPWPTLSVVDLDSKDPQPTFGPRLAPQDNGAGGGYVLVSGFGGGGGGRGYDESTPMCSGGQGLCDAFGGDLPCLAFAKASCCGQFMACAVDPQCKALLACLASGAASCPDEDTTAANLDACVSASPSCSGMMMCTTGPGAPGTVCISDCECQSGSCVSNMCG